MTVDRIEAEALPQVVSGHRLDSILEDLPTERRFAGVSPQGHPIELRAFRGPRASDPVVGEALERTLAQAALLRHRAVVGVSAWGRVDGALWVAGDPTDGVTVEELLAQVGALPARAAVEVALEVAGALDHAFAVSHQVPGPPLHHGALDESRVEITAAGRVRVRDFGLSPLWEPPRAVTPPRVPPEVRAGRPFDIRGDLFSLGVLLGLLTTGSPVLPTGDAGAAAKALRALHSGGFEASLERRGRGLGKLAVRLLAESPADRYETPADAEAALLSLRGALLPDRRLDELVHEVVGAVGGRRPAKRVRAPVIRLPEDTLVTDGPPDLQLAPTARLEAPPAAPVDPTELTTAGGKAPSSELTTAPPEAGDPPADGGLGSAPTVEERAPIEVDEPGAATPPAPLPSPGAAHPEAAPPMYSMKDFVSDRPAPKPAPRVPPPPPPAPVAAPPPPPPPPPPSPPAAPPLAPPKERSPSAPTPPPPDEAGPMPRRGVLIAAGALVFGALALVLLVPGDEEPAPEPTVEAAAASPDDAFAVPAPEPPPDDPDTPDPSPETPPEPSPATTRSPTPPPSTVAESPRPPAIERPAPTPTPPTGPVTLAVRHRPVASGAAGASELVSVRVDGPADTEVVLHFGPPGGPHQSRALGAKSGGRWEGWLPLPADGSGLEYWVSARHPAAPSAAGSGSAGAPHKVDVQ